MKRMMISVVIICLAVFTSSLFAQVSDLKKHPGYVDMDEIRIPDKAESVTDIDLGPALLALTQLGQSEGDKDLSEGLAGILSIRIKSFEIDYDDTPRFRKFMEKREKELQKDGWINLVRSRTPEDMTNITMRIVDGKVVGFFLMSIEEGESLSFANVFGGNIDLGMIRNLGMGLGDSALDSLRGLEEW